MKPCSTRRRNVPWWEQSLRRLVRRHKRARAFVHLLGRHPSLIVRGDFLLQNQTAIDRVTVFTNEHTFRTLLTPSVSLDPNDFFPHPNWRADDLPVSQDVEISSVKQSRLFGCLFFCVFPKETPVEWLVRAHPPECSHNRFVVLRGQLFDLWGTAGKCTKAFHEEKQRYANRRFVLRPSDNYPDGPFPRVTGCVKLHYDQPFLTDGYLGSFHTGSRGYDLILLHLLEQRIPTCLAQLIHSFVLR